MIVFFCHFFFASNIFHSQIGVQFECWWKQKWKWYFSLVRSWAYLGWLWPNIMAKWHIKVGYIFFRILQNFFFQRSQIPTGKNYPMKSLMPFAFFVIFPVCAQYAKYSYHENYLTNQEYGVAKCEDLVMPLIIGGSKADRTEFPHMAAIGYGTFSKLTYLCGGTLISDKFVLSAAHCEKDHSR